MRLRTIFVAAALSICLLTGAFAFQRGRRMFNFDPPAPLITAAEAAEKTELGFARLRYPSYGGGPSAMWQMRGNWTIDYPAADRHFIQAIRRLTRIHVRSVEQVVDMESDELFNWPFVYVVEPGHWDLTDAQAKRLREFLLKGGFLMTDDFHGTYEWRIFTDSLNRVFPDRPVVDIENSDQIFHMLYNLDDKFQVPGLATFGSGGTYEYDGIEPKWRGIYDDKGRIMVGILHNMDLGDAWEYADDPDYPEKYARMAINIGINYVMYAFTH